MYMLLYIYIYIYILCNRLTSRGRWRVAVRLSSGGITCLTLVTCLTQVFSKAANSVTNHDDA